MDLHDRRALKAAARNSLAAATYDPRKLILIHTGISVGLSLLCTIIDYVLSLQIQNTGGLGGLGTRSILSTARSVLQVIVSLGLPFWEAGYCFATIKIVRGKEANPASLLEGFRRFGPLLRAMMLQSIIYIAVLILCFTVGSRIFLLTPLSDPFYEIMQTAQGVDKDGDGKTDSGTKKKAILAAAMAYGFNEKNAERLYNMWQNGHW